VIAGYRRVVDVVVGATDPAGGGMGEVVRGVGAGGEADHRLSDEMARIACPGACEHLGFHAGVATRTGIAEFLAGDNEWIQLAVIGSSEAHQVAQLIGPHSHPTLGRANCSVLVVRSSTHPTTVDDGLKYILDTFSPSGDIGNRTRGRGLRSDAA
jgi:hypothetical protein